MRKGQRSWGGVAVPNLRTKQTLRNTKILTFGPIIASVTIKVSLQLNGMLMMWKLQQAMQDDVIQTARIHPTVYPGNRDEVFIWPISCPLGEILGTKLAHPFIWTHQKFYKGFRRQDLGNQASPVNRAHIKRPLETCLHRQTSLDLIVLSRTKYTPHMFRFYIQTSYINNSLQSSRFFFTE